MITIPLIKKASDFDIYHATVPIKYNSWCTTVRIAIAPTAFVRIAYLENVGLMLYFFAAERKLLAKVNVPDGPVCEDSCMEAFLDLAPETGKGYINVEVNPIANMYLAFGKDRYDRRFIRPMRLPDIHPKTTITESSWTLEYTIPEELIFALYGKKLGAGDVFCGNFYICADGKEAPYYGSAAPITAPEPDFHRPEFFREFIIK